MRPSDQDVIRRHVGEEGGGAAPACASCGAVPGRVFWRSLDELCDSPEFREALHREFPPGASEPHESFSRRSFLKLMGASAALAAASGSGAGCYRQPEEQILPYVDQPEILVPGKPLFFATAIPFRGYGIGALVESHMGRPTKVEGNPDHPASLGATHVFMQASVMTFYDPFRSQVVTRGGEVSTWTSFIAAMQPELRRFMTSGGAGLRLLTGTITSPTLLAQIDTLLKRFPQARWHRFDPAGRDNVVEGARLAFGKPVDTVYDFTRARVVVSLESNFLLDDPGSVAYARQFILGRRIPRPTDPPTARPRAQGGVLELNRLFVAEASPSITGAMADQRLPVMSSRIQQLALAILGINPAGNEPVALRDDEDRWVRHVVAALEEHHGASIVLAGESQPAAVHALAHAINRTLGNVGQTVHYIDPVAPPPDEDETIEALAQAIDAGEVDTLMMIGSNPAYTAPADLDFPSKLLKVRLRVHQGLYNDETGQLSQWHIPITHDLEAWSDVRAFNGVATIIQPLIAPLYANRTPHELLGVLLGEEPVSSYHTVRAFWQNRLGLSSEQFEPRWREALHLGLVAHESAPQRLKVEPNLQAITGALARSAPTTAPATQPAAGQAVEINFRPDPTVWDGTFSNNPWLQECPKPLTKLTWDNAASISPAMARRLRLSNEDVVRLRFRGRELLAAVMIVPGHADNAVSITLGYGRSLRSLPVAFEQGFNAYRLRTSDAPWFGLGLEIESIGRRYPLATTQNHFLMEGRDIIRVVEPAQLDRPHVAEKHFPEETAPKAGKARKVPLSIYPDQMPSDPPYRGYAWGMSIDLSSCIGCNACVVACVAENNIPMVGKDGVRNGREMLWLRVDRYYSADGAAAEHSSSSAGELLTNPQTYFQPVPCMHCEKAPCEVVCPVAATTHSDEGINEMTYNRCIGTRYCSNNCPYKVRRFNFFEYNPPTMPAVEKMQHNPDVTVRSRGVMEKCTYCIQRINDARQETERMGRRIGDGEVVTACAQACPTQAIVFGDINNPRALVHAMKFAEPFSNVDYGLLNAELGTRPRTTYLPRLVSGGTDAATAPAPPQPGEH